MIKRKRVTKIKTNEEILNELNAELTRLNTTTRRIYDSRRSSEKVCSQTVCKYLGVTWREAVSLAFPQPKVELLPKEEQLKVLKEEFERIGSYKKRVYAENRNKEKLPNPDLLCEYLNMSWREITNACGALNVIENINDSATDEDLIIEYKTLSEHFGRPLTIRELNNHTKYSFDIYIQHFGTISELKTRCGYEVRIKTITKEECTQELIRIYKEQDKVLTYDEVIEHSKISVTTILNRFQTTKIKKVWEEVLKDEG